jgi:aarF domain-containing kinase
VNGGVYIKVGQHVATLAYIVPPEYCTVLGELYDAAPTSTIEQVHAVIKAELYKGSSPALDIISELFDDFNPIPLASASLAQVHTAVLKGTKTKVAIKVQHPLITATAPGDVWMIGQAVKVLSGVFKGEFDFDWLVDEIAPQIYKELDFTNEAANAEKCRKHLLAGGFSDNVIVPTIHYSHSSTRVLCMNFEEGETIGDLNTEPWKKKSKTKIHDMILRMFNYQVYHTGFIHCDPHPVSKLNYHLSFVLFAGSSVFYFLPSFDRNI